MPINQHKAYEVYGRKFKNTPEEIETKPAEDDGSHTRRQLKKVGQEVL